MPVSDKLRAILRSKTRLTEAEIEALPTDAHAWKSVYLSATKKNGKDVRPQICFTGFDAEEKETLFLLAEQSGFCAVDSVTKGLKYLVAGTTAGPSKLQKAIAQGVLVLTAADFRDTCQRR
jgi:NAD-dependent DNA ligase